MEMHTQTASYLLALAKRGSNDKENSLDCRNFSTGWNGYFDGTGSQALHQNQHDVIFAIG